MTDTFCILPFMHLATNASGNLRICCNSIPGENFILKEDGSPYKIYKDNLEEAWNSNTYRVIRDEFLNNKRPDMCARCFREEDAGIVSPRHAWNQKWKEDKTYTVDMPYHIKYIDLRLGNLCNLRCRMCNPYASNQWLKEWHLIDNKLSSDEQIRLKRMDWPKDKKTWDNLMPLLDSVEEVYLTGGEPTIIKEQFILLDYLIDQNLSQKVKLKYNTNLTNIPVDLLAKWKLFKKIQLNCSIDAIGDLDRYIRYPSDWNTIVENFNILNKLDNVNIEIHCTVQMYNILRLQDLIEWALPYDVKIYFNILNHPNWLNIRVLPIHLKKYVEKNLQKYYDLNKVKGIVDYMNAEHWVEHLPNFYKNTDILDKSRNENLKSILKEFYK